MDRMRENGVLMHISALPGPYGIGTFGASARQFIHKLAQAGVTYWQVLPFTIPGEGFSPYASISAFAGNPLFIDPDLLCEAGLLTPQECLQFHSTDPKVYRVDPDFVRHNHEHLLRLAFTRCGADAMTQILKFARTQPWLSDFALFQVLLNYFEGEPWWLWPDLDLRYREAESLNQFAAQHEAEIHYIYFVQWLFFEQWQQLKAEANDAGIGILGDIPLYVARNSADVWANPQQFYLDQDLNPVEVAGVPPDYFSEDGQLWGNPLYNWDHMATEDYAWWIERMRFSLQLYDRVRIDHFRGFESYWAVPVHEKTAKHGRWCKGPGLSFFQTVRRVLGEVNIIAEDLGDINDDVRSFVQTVGFPGMKVFQFGFNLSYSDMDMPHRYTLNQCAYTGTHDNQTLLGWLMSMSHEMRQYVLDYVGFPLDGDWLRGGEGAPAVQAMIRCVWGSPAFFAVAPIQDLLGYGDDTRFNVPGVPDGNWCFRLMPGVLESWNTDRLRRLNLLYGRFRPFYHVQNDEGRTEIEQLVHQRQLAKASAPIQVMAALAKINSSENHRANTNGDKSIKIDKLLDERM